MDNLTKEQRHRNMSNIRSRDTNIEKCIFTLLNARRVKYKKHYNIYGKPDIVFPHYKTAVFLDSDFWHGWRFPQWKNRLPKVYWRKKIENNIRRDKNNFSKLRSRGWKVIRLWGHQIKSNPELCCDRIIDAVNARKKCSSKNR